MAATMQLQELNGAGPTGTNAAGGVRFRNADTAAIDITNPLVKAGVGGVVRSFKKSLRLFCTLKNTSTQIANIRFYTGSSAWGTGIVLFARSASLTTTYSQAVGAEASDTNFTDASTYTSGAPLTVDATTYTLTDATAVAHNIVDLHLTVTTSGDGTTPVVGTVAAGCVIAVVWDEV